MVDFEKLRKKKEHVTPIDPKEIFMRIPKSPEINDLWASQAEALKDWFGRRTDKDIVIKLNTGGGKTLVGLLMAQSIINEHHGPVLYLCPTIQLVNQTQNLSKQYGIPAIAYDSDTGLDGEFLSGRRILIATYSTLFNGQTRFGIANSTRDIIPLAGIILDDAHTAFEHIREVFTLSISSSEMDKLYKEITSIFRSDFNEIDKQGTFDDVINGRDYQTVLEIPYWSWLSKHGEIRDLLSKEESQREFRFTWPLLRDAFPLCHALVSSRDFCITSMYPIIEMFPSFTNCPHRIYMSATVADDSSIIRTFDASLESISKPIAPASLAGVGERMILAPNLTFISRSEIDTLVNDLIKQISEDYGGAVILCPSKRASESWKKVARYAEQDEVAKCVHKLNSGEDYGPFVFPNRYDGIDLPGDSCRLLVLAGLPRGGNSYDLYRAIVFEGSSVFNTTIAQRIEQGMGRGTRGAGDHCVVILVGKDLIDWISRTANMKLLTATTCAQLELGIDISHEISSTDDFKKAIYKCLDRDDDWTKCHVVSIADSVQVPSIHHENLTSAECERKFFKFAREGAYSEAISLIEKFVKDNNTKLDSRLQGWLLQLAAHIAYLWGDSPKADQLQRKAYSMNKRTLRPKVAPMYVKIAAPSKQSENIVSQLSDRFYQKGFFEYFEAIADYLVSTATSNQFEEAVKNLATVLGFEAQRPEKEYGKGPDDLWIIDGKTALVIEAKSQKLPDNPLTKKEHAQLLEAYEWFQKEYPEYKDYKVVIHPNANAIKEVTVADTYALTLKDLSLLVIDTRKLIGELCAEYLPKDRLMSKCDALLQRFNLTPKDIIGRYLTAFKNINI